MSQASAQSPLDTENDVARLYSQFGKMKAKLHYVECVRDELAIAAGRRWPFLCEIMEARLEDIDRKTGS